MDQTGLLLVMMAAALCSAAPAQLPAYPAPHYPPPQQHKKAHPYQFEYAVKDEYQSLDFGHKEDQDDAGVVTGKYYVLLPDGRTQIVEYTADHHAGYQVQVSYEGEALPAPKYPAHPPKYAPQPPRHPAPAPKHPVYPPKYHPRPAYHPSAPAPHPATQGYPAPQPYGAPRYPPYGRPQHGYLPPAVQPAYPASSTAAPVLEVAAVVEETPAPAAAAVTPGPAADQPLPVIAVDPIPEVGELDVRVETEESPAEVVQEAVAEPVQAAAEETAAEVPEVVAPVPAVDDAVDVEEVTVDEVVGEEDALEFDGDEAEAVTEATL